MLPWPPNCPATCGRLAGPAARLIGMHCLDETAALLGGIAPGPEGFARYLVRMARGHGDDATLRAEGDAWIVRQTTWQLMRERPNLPREAFDAWHELWVGAALAHDLTLFVDVIARRDRGDPAWEWRIGRAPTGR